MPSTHTTHESEVCFRHRKRHRRHKRSYCMHVAWWARVKVCRGVGGREQKGKQKSCHGGSHRSLSQRLHALPAVVSCQKACPT